MRLEASRKEEIDEISETLAFSMPAPRLLASRSVLTFDKSVIVDVGCLSSSLYNVLRSRRFIVHRYGALVSRRSPRVARIDRAS